ncbi:phosphogluconate dehydrogenase (NAD(+)-dependent, decarboxylating) [Bacillus sp. Marseille-P3661]|uniref:phosphogluconate dehydrogenase (NAD(+)-dependent, decarboxylating) n=1 Tax=Bacillus sp. Marseille-P3661 TaxID=1936234 RepID=UPI000C8417F1|nr:decarboxylating 6-phosphogluconate dehydrogenase [Bacillus sp. Marseille-P3661]
MQLGLIGLGKMGYNLALNLLEHGHSLIANDISEEQVKSITKEGAIGTYSIAELIGKLDKPRNIWIMVPAGPITDQVLTEVLKHIDKGDRIIDGGNSNPADSLRRAELVQQKEAYFFDVGTSGGTEGAREGACFMIGGNAEQFKEIEPIFKSISVENGYLYAGIEGSGHFLKMVHNGIEYGMMQSIAEGFEVLHKSQFDYDFEAVARVWNHGSVIRSWLMELTQNIFSKDAKLEGIQGVMHSSGHGKWTIENALELQVPTPVIALSLMMRYRSLEEDTFSGKVVAALRNEFGGHKVIKN